MINRQARIQQLQQQRRNLLARREERSAPLAQLDLELTRVRAELLALYEIERQVAPTRLAG